MKGRCGGDDCEYHLLLSKQMQGCFLLKGHSSPQVTQSSLRPVFRSLTHNVFVGMVSLSVGKLKLESWNESNRDRRMKGGFDGDQRHLLATEPFSTFYTIYQKTHGMHEEVNKLPEILQNAEKIPNNLFIHFDPTIYFTVYSM